MDCAALIAVPVVLLGIAIYGLCRNKSLADGWHISEIFVSAMISGIIAFFEWVVRSRSKKLNLILDPQSSSITFRHFRFTASFLPEKPREEEIIRFDQIISTDILRDPEFGGIDGLELRTKKGKVVISKEIEHFAAISGILSGLETANALRADEFQRLQAELKIKTPWYGWLILLISVIIVIYVEWKFIY